MTENTHRWPSQAIGPAQTKAGDVGVSDMGWCLRRFRRVTLKALWCVQNDVKGCSDIKSSLHMLYPWVNSIYLLFITFHAVSGQNEEVMLCLVNQFYQALQQEPSFFHATRECSHSRIHHLDTGRPRLILLTGDVTACA